MPDAPTRRHIVSVSSSSKKSGKSTVAAYLVRELAPVSALKVSSGSHAPSPIVTDVDIISRKGTDTGSLMRAGAEKVVWVNAPPGMLAETITEAIGLFPADATIIVEGNSALEHLDVSFSVFVMTVPFEEFKPSADKALARADLVLVDMRWKLAGSNESSIETTLSQRAPGARAFFFADEDGLDAALRETADLALRNLRRSSQ